MSICPVSYLDFVTCCKLFLVGFFYLTSCPVDDYKIATSKKECFPSKVIVDYLTGTLFKKDCCVIKLTFQSITSFQTKNYLKLYLPYIYRFIVSCNGRDVY